MGLQKHFMGHLEWGITRNDIVLDLGSGGNPIFRANLLVDKFVDSDFQRQSGMIINRPTICADGTRLPLKDKSIDFVYCSHVIEHIPDPAAFLAELTRVGKKGLIEAPHGDYEKLHPRDLHLWYVFNNDGVLEFNQKTRGVEFEGVARMYARVRKSFNDYYGFVASNWDKFNTRLFWSDEINYEINSSGDFDFNEFNRVDCNTQPAEVSKARIPVSHRVKSLAYATVRKLFFSDVDISQLLQCPHCDNSVSVETDYAICDGCGQRFKKEGKVIYMDVAE